MPIGNLQNVGATPSAPPLPSHRPSIIDDVTSSIKSALKNEGPYASEQASLSEVKDINDAVAKAPEKILNDVFSKLSDEELGRFVNDVHDKNIGLNAGDRKHLNDALAEKLDGTQQARFYNELGQQDRSELKAVIGRRYHAEAGKWNFDRLCQAYQKKADMLIGKNFHKTAKDAIEGDGSCATRLSNAFNRAGYVALYQAFENSNQITVGDRVKGGERRYIMGAENLATQLGVKQAGNKVKDISEIAGKNGIIYFRNPAEDLTHIDLYDGQEMVGNGPLTSSYTDGQIYFLELK